MKYLITNRVLIVANFVIVSYFLVIGLIHILKINFTIIGVIREILTLPFLLAQIVFLAIGINQLIKNKSNFYTTISLLALAICAIVTIGSFFCK